MKNNYIIGKTVRITFDISKNSARLFVIRSKNKIQACSSYSSDSLLHLLYIIIILSFQCSTSFANAFTICIEFELTSHKAKLEFFKQESIRRMSILGWIVSVANQWQLLRIRIFSFHSMLEPFLSDWLSLFPTFSHHRLANVTSHLRFLIDADWVIMHWMLIVLI